MNATAKMSFETIRTLIKDDLSALDELILAHLNSKAPLINQLGFYLISSGGKRIRPVLAILAAKSLGYKGDKHITTGAFIEFIHSATLLHDDVVDESALRRGKETANNVYGNAAAVLVGDFIYTRAFELMTDLQDLRILALMSKATNVIAEGEVMQLLNCNDPSISEEQYLDVIYSKTARLFEVACQVSGILAGASDAQEQGLALYGRYLGTAFQLVDDVLDYSANAKALGKNIGDDLAEGKPTLPLLHLLKNGNEKECAFIRDLIENPCGAENLAQKLPQVLAMMEQHDSLNYAMQMAKNESLKAVESLQDLPPTEFKDALISLALLAVDRNY